MGIVVIAIVITNKKELIAPFFVSVIKLFTCIIAIKGARPPLSVLQYRLIRLVNHQWYQSYNEV